MDHQPPQPSPARRVAVVAASLVAIGVAVVVLREPDGAADGPRPVPPPQTTVAPFTSEGVVVPEPGGPPAAPRDVLVAAGPARLNLTWPAVADAAGYEVRWGERVRLVAQAGVQLDGLADGLEQRVEVRSVGKHGERSEATVAVGAPRPAQDSGWAFAEEFDRAAPDPARWRFTSVSGCGSAAPGTGDDERRLVIIAQCGSEPVALAARAPLRLADGPELARLTVDTDQPGVNGELLLDLVPGQVAQIGGGAGGDVAGAPGAALDDAALPPGAIRVRIAARPGAPTSAQVLVAPGTPRRGTSARVAPISRAGIGVTVRWEVVLRTDGVRVLRDGVVVGAGDVVPEWTEATAVIGLSGGRAGVRAALDFVGFRGAATAAPPMATAPPLDAGQVVHTAGGAPRTPSGGALVAGVTGGRLLLTLAPQNGPDERANDVYSVEIGGKRYPARPAVAGQPMRRGVRYPVLADLPPDALVLRADGRTLPLRVHGPAHRGRAQTRVLAAHLELTPSPGTTPTPPAPPNPQERTRPALARPSAVLLDAAGRALTEGGRAPRGRLVLELTLDAAGGQQLGGELAGLAGVEVRLDRAKLAGIPTIVDGPGVGGTWRIAIDTTALAPGRHTVEVRAVGVDARSAFAVSYTPFEVV